jgi:hypothetical protein
LPCAISARIRLVPSCAGRDLHAAAGIQNGDNQRLQFFLDALGEGGIENLAGDVEGEFGHEIGSFAIERD